MEKLIKIPEGLQYINRLYRSKENLCARSQIKDFVEKCNTTVGDIIYCDIVIPRYHDKYIDMDAISLKMLNLLERYFRMQRMSYIKEIGETFYNLHFNIARKEVINVYKRRLRISGDSEVAEGDRV